MWVLRSQLRQFAVIVDVSTRQHKQWVFVLSIIQWYAVIFKKEVIMVIYVWTVQNKTCLSDFFFIVFEKSDVDLFWNSVNFLCFVKLLRNLPKKITKNKLCLCFLCVCSNAGIYVLQVCFPQKFVSFKFFNPRFFWGEQGFKFFFF